MLAWSRDTGAGVILVLQSKKIQQFNALLRKSLAYQRKNVWVNVCVLLAPIILAILLAILQKLFDDLLLDIEVSRHELGPPCSIFTTNSHDSLALD
jgi:hypothetical protein